MRTLDETGLASDTLVVYTSDHGDNLGTRTFWGKSNMYEESVGVPLILRGPGIPAGRRVATPVSLVDAYPTIIEAVGETLSGEERALPGRSLLGLLDGRDADRTRVQRIPCGRVRSPASSWCGSAATNTCTMKGTVRSSSILRPIRWRRAISHLEGGHESVIAEGERRLRAICDPARVSQQAFDDQERRILEFGGRDAVLERGSYPYTPAPGEVPRYS